MAASKIGGLFVSLDLNFAKFTEGLDKSRTKATTFGVAVGNIMSSVAISFARMAVDAAASLPRLVSASIDFSDQINKTAQRTGIAVESLSALSHAAKLSDVGLESLSTGVGRLSRQMNEAANGSKSAEKIFESLGISATGANGALRPVDDVLGDVAEKFAGLEDGAQKTALAIQIFGKGGQSLIPLLNQGRDGLAAMKKEAEQLGLVITSDTAQAAEEFNDNLTRLQSTIDGIGLSLSAKLLPQLNAVTNAMVEFVKQSDLIESIGTGLAQVFASIAAYAGAIAVRFTTLQLGVQELDLLIVRTGNRLGIFSDQYLAQLELRISKTYERFDDLVEITQKLENLKVPKTLAPGFTAAPSISTRPFGPFIPKPGIPLIDPEAEKAAKKADDLRETFLRALKPADDLAGELGKLRGKFSDMDIIKVYGDAINKAAAQQREFGFSIPPLITNLEALDQSQKDTALFNSVAKREGEAFAATLASISDGSLDTVIKLGLLHEQMAKTEDELEKLNAFGTPRDFGFIEAMNLDELEIKAPKIKATMEKLSQAGEQIGQAISSGIEDAMRKWEGFGKLAIGILNDIAATILRNSVTAPLTSWLGDAINIGIKALGGIGGGAAASAASGAFTAGAGSLSHVRLDGFRAEGGPVQSGGRYMVGEQGPEIFVPKTSGNIIPNDALQGGGTQTVIQYNIDARGASAGIGAEIKRALRDVEDRAVMRSIRTAQELKLRTV